MDNMKKELVVGLGNILLSDEGIGIHILRELEKEVSLKDADFLDMGTSSMDLGYYIGGSIEKMVIIDCLQSEDPPGSIYMLRPRDLASKKEQEFSLHQLKLVDTIKLASIETDFPETVILGIVPYDAGTFSEDLSPEIRALFPFIYRRVLGIIEEFLGRRF